MTYTEYLVSLGYTLHTRKPQKVPRNKPQKIRTRRAKRQHTHMLGAEPRLRMMRI